MIKQFNTEAEWLEYKKDKISASMIGSITDLNKYESKYKTWELMTGRAEKSPATLQMVAGSKFEYGVMEIFKHFNEIEYLRDRSKILLYQNDDYPFICVTPDDIAIYEGEEMLVEVKTTTIYFDATTIPEYYKAQVNFQMGNTGYNKCLFLWFDHIRRDLNHTIIEFDKEYYDYQIEAAVGFNYLVETDMPPPMTTASDFDSLTSKEGVVYGDESVLSTLIDIEQTNEKIKALKKRSDALKTVIKKFMGEFDKLSINGEYVATYNSSERNTIDVEKLSKHPELYEECKEVTKLRTLKINYKKLQ